MILNLPTMDSTKRKSSPTKGKTMDAKEAAKTMLVGFALVLAVTAGAGAWGVSRGIVTSVPAEGAWGFLAVAILAVVSIPVSCIAFRSAK
jgi:hypothetical protein